MDTVTISYRITFPGKQKTKVFEFTLDSHNGGLVGEPPANPPAWTALEYRQCSHCPLDKAQHAHCPIALQLHRIIEEFHDTTSIDEVALDVVTEERHISRTVPLQRAIGSMLGLVSPVCGCPKMAYMKPMARFHLPLATEEETAFRVIGTFLLAQYLRGKIEHDLHGLKAIYEDLRILNRAMASRLQGATESDSSKNAIVLLDMYSNLVPMMIDDKLPELRALFDAYGITPLPNPAVIAPRKKTAEEVAVEALMQEVEADELAALLGTKEGAAAKKVNVKSTDKPQGRAVFKLPDEE